MTLGYATALTMLKRSCMRVARFIKYRRQLNASTDQRRMTIDSELSGVDGSVVDVITAVKHLALTLFVDVFAARLLAIECNVRSRHSLSSATIASLSMKPAENSCLTSVTETAYTARFVVNNCSPSLVVRAVPSTRVLENLKKNNNTPMSAPTYRWAFMQGVNFASYSLAW